MSTEAKCVRCGCTDSRACPGGCSWAWVDYEKGEGLCMACVEGEVTAELGEVLPY